MYFGHGAAKLTLAEAALLAGIPADPSLYDPVDAPAATRERAGARCCRRCSTQGDIDAQRVPRGATARRCRSREDVRLPGDAGAGASTSRTTSSSS